MNTEQAQSKPDTRPAPKWAAIINDTLIPMPSQRVRAAVLREQGGIPDDQMVVRDHDSDHDPVISDADMVNLAEGNVFEGVAKTDVEASRPTCQAPAKLAYSVNDQWQEVIRPRQTGRTLRDLFNLADNVELLRDRHSPDDEVVADRDDASFEYGCVFKTRHVVAPPVSLNTVIIVNGRERTVTGETISFDQVVVLAFGAVDPQTIYTMAYTEGPAANREGSMVAGTTVHIQKGMIFNVTPTRRS